MTHHGDEDLEEIFLGLTEETSVALIGRSMQ
jgi:hypothetical protein